MQIGFLMLQTTGESKPRISAAQLGAGRALATVTLFLLGPLLLAPHRASREIAFRHGRMPQRQTFEAAMPICQDAAQLFQQMRYI